MLVYLSADGAKRNAREHDDKGYTGGIATATNFVRKNAGDGAAATAATLAGGKGTVDGIGGDLVHCLHPNDLAPFTRKPMFLIVDSTNSAAFQNIPRVFSAPLVCLMGPTEYPSSIKDTTQIGSLFTLFLHVPIKAFAFISNITQLSTELWNDCNTKLGLVEKTISDVVEANVSTMGKKTDRE